MFNDTQTIVKLPNNLYKELYMTLKSKLVARISEINLVIWAICDDLEVPILKYTFELHRQRCRDYNLNFENYINYLIKSACEWVRVDEIQEVSVLV